MTQATSDEGELVGERDIGTRRGEKKEYAEGKRGRPGQRSIPRQVEHRSKSRRGRRREGRVQDRRYSAPEFSPVLRECNSNSPSAGSYRIPVGTSRNDWGGVHYEGERKSHRHKSTSGLEMSKTRSPKRYRASGSRNARTWTARWGIKRYRCPICRWKCRSYGRSRKEHRAMPRIAKQLAVSGRRRTFPCDHPPGPFARGSTTVGFTAG